MGIPDPYQIYDNMPAHLLEEWMAYDFLYPFNIEAMPLQNEYNKKRPKTEEEEIIHAIKNIDKEIGI